jgi:hypothetical protein
MGWKPAQEASGVSWMAPLLGQLLDDPYEAVRLIAYRSLHGLPGFREFKYNFMSPDTRMAVADASAIWERGVDPNNRRTDPELVLDSRGHVNLSLLKQLKRERNDRRISLRE